MPFRFHTINNNTEVIVNEFGDYLYAEKGTSRKIVNRKIKKTEKIYADLISNFIISEKPASDIIDIAATRYRTKKSFLNDFTSLHIMVITLRGDHTCHYCQVSRQTEEKDKFDISYENLDLSLELIFNSPSNDITIEGQGGEPLHAFEKIKYCVSKSKKINESFNKKISYVICTNLAPVTEEILHYCKEENILISTSYDGPKHLHDKNRPFSKGSSHEKVLNGIDLARKIVGHDNVSALMTTTNLTLKYPTEIIDDYIEKGFRGVFLRNISPYGFAIKAPKRNKYDTKSFLDFYKKSLDYIIQINKKGINFVEEFTTIIMTKILTPFPVGFVDLQSPAGLINSVLVYNYDGYLYASDEARMLAEMNDKTFCLGHVKEDYLDLIKGSKVQEIAKFWSNESLPGCSDCGFQVYCGADPVFNHATQGSMVGFRPTNGYCNKNMEIIRYLFDLMNSDPINERIFRSWVHKYTYSD